MIDNKNNQETLKTELSNLEAEQSLLGTIILNNEYLSRVLEFLLPEHFYEPAHQKIYAQIIHNVEKVSIVANQITLKQFFENDENIKAVGGAKYLSTLLASASGIFDIADYGRIIYDLALIIWQGDFNFFDDLIFWFVEDISRGVLLNNFDQICNVLISVFHILYSLVDP